MTVFLLVLALAATTATGTGTGAAELEAPDCAVRIDSPLDPRGLYRAGPSYATTATANVTACAAQCCNDTARCVAFVFLAAACGDRLGARAPGSGSAYPATMPGTISPGPVAVNDGGAAAPETATTAAATGCNVTHDTPGLVREGTYFDAVSTAAATGSADACAALCCATPGCNAFSLNVPWNLGPWFHCANGKPCCSLSATVDAPVVNKTEPGMTISSGGVARPTPTPGHTPGCCMLQGAQYPLLPNTGLRNITSGTVDHAPGNASTHFRNAGTPAGVCLHAIL